MGYYKIKNITNKLAKRHSKKDSTLSINYNIGFKPNKYYLKPGEEIFISCKTLPSQIQLLKIKKLVWVSEVSENEFIKNNQQRIDSSLNQNQISNQKETKKNFEKKEIKKVIRKSNKNKPNDDE